MRRTLKRWWGYLRTIGASDRYALHDHGEQLWHAHGGGLKRHEHPAHVLVKLRADASDFVRKIERAELYEVSLVTDPLNPNCVILAPTFREGQQRWEHP